MNYDAFILRMLSFETIRASICLVLEPQQGTVKMAFVYVCTARSQAAPSLPFLPCLTLRLSRISFNSVFTKLLNKALRAPYLEGGCVIRITVPYWIRFTLGLFSFLLIFPKGPILSSMLDKIGAVQCKHYSKHFGP